MSLRLIVISIFLGLARCAQAQSSYSLVDRATQTELDAKRRLILQTELQAEREALAKAQATFATAPNQERQADVHRHTENVKALQRELDGVVGEPSEARKPVRLIVKAMRRATASAKKSPRFWDPYNRAPESADFSTTHEGNHHEDH